MSRTNRPKRDGEADYYPTPAWCVHRLLEEVPLLGCGSTWLEPSAGDGAIVRAVGSWAGDRRPTWLTMDIRPDTSVDVHCDFLSSGVNAFNFFDVCITNPPYNQAQAFVEAAMECSRVVVMLLRLNWLGGQERAAFLRERPPSVFVLPNRPSFDGRGTDATEYGWFVWGLHDAPVLRVLATTPKEERFHRGFTPSMFSDPVPDLEQTDLFPS